MQRRGFARTEKGKTKLGIRVDLRGGGEKESGVMWFIQWWMLSQPWECLCWARGPWKATGIFLDWEGRAQSESRAGLRFLGVIVIDDQEVTILSCPLNGMALLYFIFIACSAGCLYIKHSRTIKTNLLFSILWICLFDCAHCVYVCVCVYVLCT